MDKENKGIIYNIIIFFIIIISAIYITSRIDIYIISCDLGDIFHKNNYERRYSQNELYENLKDFSINGDKITSTSNDPWIYLDTLSVNYFKYIKIDIKILNNDNTDIIVFFATEERNFHENTPQVYKLINGINQIRIPDNNYKAIRLDLTDKEGVSFIINSVELTNKYYPSIFKIIFLILLNIAWLGIWYSALINDNKFIKNFKIFDSKFDSFYKICLHEKYIYIYLLFCFLLYSIWSIITPFNGSPDEWMRWDVLKYLTENWSLPRGDAPEVRNEIHGFSYAFYPYIQQIFGALFYRIVKYFTSSNHLLLFAARLPSILFSLGTIFFTYKIGLKLFSKNAAWLLVVLVSMWPQYTYISSYINNESFALFTISIIIYSWICGIKNNWDWKTCLILSIGIGLCFLSYYNAFGLILLSVIFWLFSVIIKKDNLKEIKSFVKKVIIMIIIVFAIAGWWYIRNAYLYDGDFLARKSVKETGEKYAREDRKPSNLPTYMNQGKTISMMIKETTWLKTSYQSFIAVFGYMNIYVSNIIYVIYMLIIITGITSFVVGYIKNIRQKKVIKEVTIFNAFIFLSIPIPIFLSLYFSFTGDFQPQGRYLLPMLIPLCILIVNGFTYLRETVFKYIETKKYLILFVFIIISINIICLYNVFEKFHLN